MMFWRDKIEKLLQNELPGELSHRKMLPPERDLIIPDKNSENVQTSGVLLLLFPKDNELYTCLIKRSAKMKIHAGQIGFPGGRLETVDKTPMETALRETTEEIGLPASRIEIIGKLSPLYVSVSNFLIHPFVGWTNKEPTFPINRHEVEKLLFFPLLSFLQKPWVEQVDLPTFSGHAVVPCIPFQNEFVWGATAMILFELVDLLKSGLLNQE